jgi:hypothetical protein
VVFCIPEQPELRAKQHHEPRAGVLTVSAFIQVYPLRIMEHFRTLYGPLTLTESESGSSASSPIPETPTNIVDGPCYKIVVPDTFIYIYDRLCGLVVRGPGYRSRGPGLIPGATRFSEN